MFRKSHRRQRSHHARSRRHDSDFGYKEVIIDVASHPAVKYMAAGVATAMLARLASKASERYPEISRFIQDNVDMFETNMDYMRFEIESEARNHR